MFNHPLHDTYPLTADALGVAALCLALAARYRRQLACLYKDWMARAKCKRRSIAWRGEAAVKAREGRGKAAVKAPPAPALDADGLCPHCRTDCYMCDAGDGRGPQGTHACRFVGCGGTGYTVTHLCPEPGCLQATGKVDPGCLQCHGSGEKFLESELCPCCQGSGIQTCSHCHGKKQASGRWVDTLYQISGKESYRALKIDRFGHPPQDKAGQPLPGIVPCPACAARRRALEVATIAELTEQFGKP